MGKVLKKGFSFLLGLVVAFTSIESLGTLTLHAANETQWSYSYTGTVQTFTAPKTGRYKVEAYGAAGGGSTGKRYSAGAGGYYSCDVVLKNGDPLYVCVGEKGLISGGATYNGGGAALSGAGAGGGASSVYFALHGNGTLAAYEDYQDANERAF